MSVEPMRVELKEFCQKFASALDPFAEALDTSIQTLRKVSAEAGLQTALSELQDNQHRLKILYDKARQQHTYLVIFGPLKSGKSTLMNAISGAYVSEVSSLPAYPCLVYVHEGDELGFSTTAFNGDETRYDSRDQLHETLETAHEELARRIREADEEGRTFNPAQDYDQAIRRIDFTMPAPYLKESGTILVDTPGLYTKMKYNYGQLTRDFRNTAACAVFVVKTDNLFFEQVFEEFADLLEVFSRVFLVVNVDSSKQDLSPDGSLEPALEQENPRRIVEAFENLTVSSQLRSAIDSGRLRIYVIDLLETARWSLRRQSPIPGTTEEESDAAPGEDAEAELAGAAAGDDSAAPDDPPDGGETETGTETASPAASGGAPANVGANGPQVGFEAFLGDLTEYLNSSEYLVEFMSDSLRQADSILHEVKDRVESSEIAEFRQGIEAMRERAERAERQLKELNTIRENKWDGPLNELTREIKQQVTEHSGSVLPELKERLHTEVDIWLNSDESVNDLIEKRVRPRLRDACSEARQRAVQLFDNACSTRSSGMRLSAETVGRVHGLGLSFDDIYPKFQPKVSERFDGAPKLPDARPMQEALPVRKNFVDWILFRTPARVRRRLLGDNLPSDKPIAAPVKGRRFGDDGKARLDEAVDRYAETCFAETLERPIDALFEEYRAFFQNQASERLDAKVRELEGERDTARENHELRRSVVDQLDQLDQSSETLRDEVRQLNDEFVVGKRPDVDYAKEPADAEAPSPGIESGAESTPDIGLARDEEDAPEGDEESEREPS